MLFLDVLVEKHLIGPIEISTAGVEAHVILRYAVVACLVVFPMQPRIEAQIPRPKKVSKKKTYPAAPPVWMKDASVWELAEAGFVDRGSVFKWCDIVECDTNTRQGVQEGGGTWMSDN